MIGITLTAGCQSENAVGMEKNGNGLSEEGYSVDELKIISERLNVKFTDFGNNAGVLVIPGGADRLLKLSGYKKENGEIPSAEDMFDEQINFEWDNRYWDVRRKKVLNKLARHNVCYGSNRQEANFEEKKGTIISWDEVPITKVYMEMLPKFLGEKARNLELEGNKYYNINKCGIGPHGDGERRIVIGLRLGEGFPLKFKWFKNCRSFGDEFIFNLKNGDMYVMSEKAVGNDWKCRSKETLRHCAGAKKYLVFK